jgi:uncharacterized protein YbjT (DUF2867 family)
MRVFVAGGTGAIGSHVIPALVREGHAVSALARTPEKAAALTAQALCRAKMQRVRSDARQPAVPVGDPALPWPPTSDWEFGKDP